MTDPTGGIVPDPTTDPKVAINNIDKVEDPLVIQNIHSYLKQNLPDTLDTADAIASVKVLYRELDRPNVRRAPGKIALAKSQAARMIAKAQAAAAASNPPATPATPGQKL